MALSTEDKSSKLFKHYLGTAETKTSRDFYEEAIKSSFSVKPQDIWTYADEIPTDDKLCSEKVQSLSDGQCYTWQKDENTFIDIVKKYDKYKLTPVDNGTDNSFKIVDKDGNPIKNIIPFNYYKHYYNYALYTPEGNQIYFGVGDWVVDFYSGVLTFYGQVPEGVDHNNPPLLTFYQYVGGNGFRIDPIGYEAAILPITNWKISKGTCLIDNKNDDNLLIDAIKHQADKVEENFAASYKFDGDDKNEGVALSFEKVIALLYTHNKDAVKGYDESAESDIGTVLSKKTSENENIIFVSHNTPAGTYTLSVDTTIEQDKPKKIYLDGDKKHFIVYQGPILTEDLTFEVKEDLENVSGLLLYWDRVSQDYLPFVTNEENRYNFGFPVVTSTGKIPPSVALGSISLGQYDDSITPEYYGPRNYTITIGVENGIEVKSADYIVRNKPGYYLNDIISNIKKDYPDSKLSGSIFLRSGIYFINGDLDLSVFDKVAFVGEEQNSTVIKLLDGAEKKSVVINNNDRTLTFENICFEGISFNITGENNKIVIKQVIADDFVCDNKGTDKQILVNYSSFKSVTLDNTESKQVANFTRSAFLLNNSNISSLLVKTKDSVFSSNTFINNLSYNVEKPLVDTATDIFTSCIINTLGVVPESVQLRDCFVLNDNRADNFTKPFENTILLEKGPNVRQYAKFDDPFYVEQENGYNKIKLRINKDTLQIIDGALTAVLEADDIQVKTDKLERWESYEGESPSGTNLQDVLENIYKTKADLNPNGKVPLEQLPDSISYGGLSYQGVWSFEKSKGKYPTFEDTNQWGDDSTHNDGFGFNTIQPGWFWIVDSSTKEVDNPAAPQTSIDNKIFTAGDWVICSARKDYIAFSGDNVKITLRDRGPNAIVIELSDKELKDNGSIFFSNATTTVGGLPIYSGPVLVENNIIKSIEYVKVPGMTFDFSELKFKGADEINHNLVFYSKDGQLLKCTLGDTENVSLGSEYTWEKLDRAYHDVAYMVLPQLTTGEHIEWSWQNENEQGQNDGKGALALGGQTIAESFDLINQELYKLYPPRSANINEVSLLLSEEIPTVEYCDEKGVLHTGYDLSKNNKDYWSIKSDKGFFYGNSADISLYVKKDDIHLSTVKAKEYKNNEIIEDTENNITLVLSTTDPYEGGPGAGIWKEAALECKFKPTTIEGINTSYTLHAGIDKIQPTTQNSYNQESKSLKLDFVKPVMPKSIKVENIINNNIITSKIDNTDYINNNFILTLSYFDLRLETTGDFNVSKHFRQNGIVKISNPGFETVSLDINKFTIYVDDSNNVTLALKNSIEINVNVDNYQKNFPLTFTYTDIYDQEYSYTSTINNNKVENIHIDGKRRSSGDTSNKFPEYSNNNADTNAYGYSYEHNDNELIFTGDYVNGERKLVYKANSEKDGYYGALTFELDDVKEINGLVLDVISPDDLTVNKYSNVTDQFDLYAQILETTQSDNPTASQWINCNAPYDGFSIPGNFADNIQEAFSGMYAGSSNSHKKRITFGTKTLSGKLFVRLLLKNKDTRIQDIKLVEVI